MQDKFFILGLATCVALSFFYGLVRRHQATKRRQRHREAVLRNRL